VVGQATTVVSFLTDAYSCIEDIMHGYNTGSLEAIKIYTYQNKALALIDNSASANGKFKGRFIGGADMDQVVHSLKLKQLHFQLPEFQYDLDQCFSLRLRAALFHLVSYAHPQSKYLIH
jgi:hypothetical protein